MQHFQFTKPMRLFTVLACLLGGQWAMAQPNLQDRLEQHVFLLAADSLEGRGVGTEGRLKAIAYITEQFETLGLKPIGEHFVHPFFWRRGIINLTGKNIIGLLPGNDPLLQDEYLVIGAHFDHLGFDFEEGKKRIYPGADDNASGVAGMLEIARLLSAEQGSLKRSILFIAFDAEESGLVGSRQFVQQANLVPITQIKAMFSLDMLGMYAANGGLDLKGIGGLDKGKELAESIAAAKGLTIKNVSGEIERRTDTYFFGMAGIPAIHAFTGLKSPYHKPADTAEKLDYAGMAEIVPYLAELTLGLSQAAVLLPSAAFQRVQDPAGKTFKADFGAVIGGGSARNRHADEFYRAFGVLSLQAGFFNQLHFGKAFTLETRLLYDMHGSQAEAGTFRRHALTVPLAIQWNMFGSAAEGERIFPLFGGYYRYHFAGNLAGIPLDFDQIYRQQEWGWCAGVGMAVERLNLTLQWNGALQSITQSDSPSVRNQGLNFAVGYRFGK